ncbi:type IV pilus twitching motility protein PilT [Patescibacteria group bacterium]|nr:type IV pilus twitching motility protein PilT [Patescibacteria group bacterium]MBU1868542.1 type IV pilus twitching motility protein PilT [Patescibacteria group bacterium]
MSKYNIQDLLEETVKRNASDLHLNVGAVPTFRVNGRLVSLEGAIPLYPEDTEQLCFSLAGEEQKEILLANKEIDFSFALGQLARFRANLYHQKGYLAAALRYIPSKIRSLEELNMPLSLRRFANLKQGFVLIVGPTGSGKSTTLASLINEININRSEHIVTVEDPIEYVYSNRRSLVSQRELHLDTHSWEIALRSVLREDPDVVLVGEMRDFDTIAAALTIAETGHLVFSTLHTNSATQTINRIIDVFPEHQQKQARAQLAAVLEGIISQRLIRGIEDRLWPATEVLLATPAVRALIREEKAYQIDNTIATSLEMGMMTLEQSLASLIKAGKISFEEAQRYAVNQDALVRILGKV